MNERLKKLRKTLDLTQQEFADKIGSKRNTIAKYETSANTPSVAVISLICREFNVNEEWLRTGNGEMFLPTNRNADISKFIKRLLVEEEDSFKNRFISMLANLTVDEWELLEKKAKELYEGTSKSEQVNKLPSVEFAEEEYIKKISSSAQNTTSTVLSSTNVNDTQSDKREKNIG